MKSAIKTLAILMMLVSVNLVSAQTFSNRAIVSTTNNETAQPAYQQFEVTAQLVDGIVHITWSLPVSALDGFYITERSDDGTNYLPIALKRFRNLPEGTNNPSTIQYSLEDKTSVEGTAYYKFSKANQQGDVLQSSIIPITAPNSTASNPDVTMNLTPKP